MNKNSEVTAFFTNRLPIKRDVSKQIENGISFDLKGRK